MWEKTCHDMLRGFPGGFLPPRYGENGKRLPHLSLEYKPFFYSQIQTSTLTGTDAQRCADPMVSCQIQ